ncbi:scm-like with four MBT domains protein 1 [Limulus polyphemus]|uniref:Scm-like with four MBT domains protein 1 n=1 Tax=Limulus polyphemus TaxID=6850 RepID=A0ABM1C5U2_LIMPO|nr:scm-like with four MBT domains protein 1 [Limulus polyphemus]
MMQEDTCMDDNNKQDLQQVTTSSVNLSCGKQEPTILRILTNHLLDSVDNKLENDIQDVNRHHGGDINEIQHEPCFKEVTIYHKDSSHYRHDVASNGKEQIGQNIQKYTTDYKRQEKCIQQDMAGPSRCSSENLEVLQDCANSHHLDIKDHQKGQDTLDDTNYYKTTHENYSLQPIQDHISFQIKDIDNSQPGQDIIENITRQCEDFKNSQPRKNIKDNIDSHCEDNKNNEPRKDIKDNVNNHCEDIKNNQSRKGIKDNVTSHCEDTKNSRPTTDIEDNVMSHCEGIKDICSRKDTHNVIEQYQNNSENHEIKQIQYNVVSTCGDILHKKDILVVTYNKDNNKNENQNMQHSDDDLISHYRDSNKILQGKDNRNSNNNQQIQYVQSNITSQDGDSSDLKQEHIIHNVINLHNSHSDSQQEEKLTEVANYCGSSNNYNRQEQNIAKKLCKTIMQYDVGDECGIKANSKLITTEKLEINLGNENKVFCTDDTDPGPPVLEVETLEPTIVSGETAQSPPILDALSLTSFHTPASEGLPNLWLNPEEKSTPLEEIHQESQTSVDSYFHNTELEVKQRESTGNEEDGSDTAEPEFVWEDYLDETGCDAVPPTAFLHVERSLESGLKVGAKVEIPNPDCPGTYWVASMVMTCGPLLLLRYLGFGTDRSADFWCDLTSSEVHPLGWCQDNGKEKCPPNVVKQKCPCTSWQDLLEETRVGPKVPSYILKEAGALPIEQIKQGMKIEVQEEFQPSFVWIATVLENVGGRLLLRYDGCESASWDFWLFYLSYQLHMVGWGSLQGYEYKPPSDIAHHHNQREWEKILKASFSESKSCSLQADLFRGETEIKTHNFKEGMKLEVVSPSNRLQIYPGTVIKVINNHFFLVTADDYRKEADKLKVTPERQVLPPTLCCHADSHLIFPINWAKQHGLRIHFPKGYLENPGNKEFDWEKYLIFCGAEAAPEDYFNLICPNPGFEGNMKLEAVNPFQPHQICAATVTRVIEPIMWIQLDSVDTFHPHHIVPLNSQEIFPVGWCESNSYPLKPPRTCLSKRQRKLMKKIGFTSTDGTYSLNKTGEVKSSTTKVGGKAWCPKIYFNHRCFTGPYLSKSRLAELPRHIGPGPVALVMKEAVSMLVNVAYQSRRVLRELQLHGRSDPSMQQHFLKAKHKGRTHRAMVEVARRSDQVEDFCKKICKQLECCPYLFGPKYVGDDCPERCFSLTKTKYVQNMLKKKISQTPPSAGVYRRGKGKKRRCWRVLQKYIKQKQPITAATTTNAEVGESVGNITPGATLRKLATHRKRKYKRLIQQHSPVVTRGSRFSTVSLEQRGVKRQQSLTPEYLQPPKKPHIPVNVAISGTVERSKLLTHVPKTECNVESANDVKVLKPVELKSNPLEWSVDDVVTYIKSTDCAPLARVLREQEVDGQALLLLTLPAVQEFLELKLGPAIKFCHQVEQVKLAFYTRFAK